MLWQSCIPERILRISRHAILLRSGARRSFVTTAVAFFETLSSHNPAALRRLHELPGSLIFVDEAHSALPLRLLPLAWHWMNVLADEWSCYWVLASGSLVRYWELQPLSGLSMPQPEIAELVRPDLQRELSRYESSRITFRWREKPIGRKELPKWVQEAPGPRLLILNTVQSAAVIAADMAAEFGQTHVEHLSTALTPEDRGNTIDRIRRRLADPDDADWTLVATSCVEAGVDFSFRTGFREISSLLSLLQAAGRVNRHGRNTEAVMWSFSLQDDSMLPKNPALDVSAAVLRSYFQKRLPITPELSTRSMQDELVRDDSCMSAICDFAELEAAQQFRTLAQKFRVTIKKRFSRFLMTPWHRLLRKAEQAGRSCSGMRSPFGKRRSCCGICERSPTAFINGRWGTTAFWAICTVCS